MKLLPLEDKIIVSPAQSETETSGGLIIPETEREKPQKGTVIAVGSGTEDIPMVLKEGDNILFGKFVGHEISLNNETKLIMKQSDVLAKIVD